MTNTSPVHPFTFGASDEPLFGLYQGPAGRARAQGIVLCHPMGHEYIPAYDAMKELARFLTQAGFHVLRFDYYGSGDSAGETGDGGIEAWTANVEAAIEELKATAQVKKVSLLGLRLGATLALFAARRRKDVDSVVIWEPIVRGKAYLDELQALRDAYIARILPRPTTALRLGVPLDVLGFPISDALRMEIEAVDLEELREVPRRALLVGQHDRLKSHLHERGCQVESDPIHEFKVWEKGGLSGAVIPLKTLRKIVGYMEGVR